MKPTDAGQSPGNNGDGLEAHISQQRLRALSEDWRDEILGAALNVEREGERGETPGIWESKAQTPRKLRSPVHPSTWLDRWLAWIPSPTLGVALVWALVMGTGALDGWLNGNGTSVPGVVSQAQLAEAHAQRVLLLEIAGVEGDLLQFRKHEWMESPNRPTVNRPRPRSQAQPEHESKWFNTLSKG
jgi:hypothetical protein